MLRIDWGNPKISIAEFEAFLSNYLGSQYDGLTMEGTYLYIITYSPLNLEQEDHILNYVYSLTTTPMQIISQPFSTKTIGEKNLYKRVHGIQAQLVQGENTILFTTPYNQCKITGLTIVNGESLDYGSFYVCDAASNPYYGVANAVLNQFSFNTNISKDFFKCESEYAADLILNLQLKIVYNSVSAKTIGINFLLHEVV
jgi:hypothetical protein